MRTYARLRVCHHTLCEPVCLRLQRGCDKVCAILRLLCAWGDAVLGTSVHICCAPRTLRHWYGHDSAGHMELEDIRCARVRRSALMLRTLAPRRPAPQLPQGPLRRSLQRTAARSSSRPHLRARALRRCDPPPRWPAGSASVLAALPTCMSTSFDCCSRVVVAQSQALLRVASETFTCPCVRRM